MSLDEDVAAARGAVDALERAVARVVGHYGDTVDARRLRQDTARLRDDLALLAGTGPAAADDAGAGRRYAAAVDYGDGYDEGISPVRR